MPRVPSETMKPIKSTQPHLLPPILHGEIDTQLKGQLHRQKKTPPPHMIIFLAPTSEGAGWYPLPQGGSSLTPPGGGVTDLRKELTPAPSPISCLALPLCRIYQWSFSVIICNLIKKFEITIGNCEKLLPTTRMGGEKHHKLLDQKHSLITFLQCYDCIPNHISVMRESNLDKMRGKANQNNTMGKNKHNTQYDRQEFNKRHIKKKI